MKKKILLNLIAIVFAGSVTAQITYTSASLPLPNDILSFSTAVDSLLSVSAPSSSAQVWDFTGLIAVNTSRDTIQPASAGASFADYPTSDVLQPLIGLAGGFGTTYVDVTASQIERLGGGIEIFGLSFVTAYANTHITQTLPLTYPDNASDFYQLNYGENIDSIPFLRQLIDSLVSGFIPGGGGLSPDSIRFVLEGTDNRTVDAFGSCIMTYDTLDVIRQKIVSDYEFKIEVKIPIPFFPFWFDATGLLPLPFPPAATTVQYNYLSEGFKQPIVALTLDSAETIVVNIQFLDTLINNPPNTININYLEDELIISLFPNPAQNQVNIQLLDAMPTDGYNLFVFDMMGRMVISEKAIRNNLHKIDVSALNNAQYIAILSDNAGKILKREQFEVMK